MNIADLRIITAEALGKDPTLVPENPQWDSLDKLEIISHLHDVLGEDAQEVSDLDDFSDLESLVRLLRGSGLVD
jgi:hypothetical protein